MNQPQDPSNEAARMKAEDTQASDKEEWESCPACSTMVDVSEVTPLSSVTCPSCGKIFTVLRSFDHFTLRQVIGQGGAGIVYGALDRELHRMVALKLLRNDLGESDNTMESLKEEATTMASINEPHVVRVYSTGTEHGHFYIAMELLMGGSLQNVMDDEGAINEARALNICLQVAKGLKSVHAYGFIHRDIKPANILFTDNAEAKIADFGLARFRVESGLDGPGGTEIVGTPYYLPPERVSGDPEDIRSDIYSLGATLYHAIAGRPPFEASRPVDVAMKSLSSQPVRIETFVPTISKATVFCLDRMLARQASDRFQNYDELIEHIQFALDQKHTQVTAPARRAVLENEHEQKMIGMIALGAIIIVAAAVAVFFIKKQTSSKSVAPDVAAMRVMRDTDPTLPPLRSDLGGVAASIAPVTTDSNLPSGIVKNPSFEEPVISSGGTEVTPHDGGWTFTGSSGIATTDGEYVSANGPAPDGKQVAFLKDKDTFSQQITGLTPGTAYVVSFYAAQRKPVDTGRGQTWSIFINDQIISPFFPGSSATEYTEYAADFVAADTTATLTFRGTNRNGGDDVALFDAVQVKKPVLVPGVVPKAPSGLVASATFPGTVHLSWTDESDNERRFKLERKDTPTGEYKEISSLPSNWKTSVDEGTTGGVEYWYRLRATNDSGDSAYSEPASVKTPPEPKP